MRVISQTAPLFPVAVGLIAGMVVDRQVLLCPAVYLSILTAASCCLLVRFVRESGGPVLLAVGALGAGGLLHITAARTIPPDSIERFAQAARQIARIRGRIETPPEVRPPPEQPFQRWTFGGERTAFLLEVDSIEGTGGPFSASGLVLVSVGEAVLDLRVGARVELHGWLSRLEPPRNPGSFDWSARNRRDGVVARFVSPFRESVRCLEAPPAGQRTILDRFRQRVRGLLTDDLTTGADEELGLLDAMILGHRSALDRRLNEVFVRAGCAHFLAVSGMHVVIVMFLAHLVGRVIGLSRRGSSLLMLLTVIVYASIAEPRPSILRAAVMASLFCLARIIGRQHAGLNWLAASAVVLAAVDPLMCFDVGYQLSFAAVLGVRYLSPAATGLAGSFLWPGRPDAGAGGLGPSVHPGERGSGSGLSTLLSWLRMCGRRLLHHAGSSVALSVGAWLATLPIIAIYFQRIQLWGAISTLILFPLVAAVMGIGFTKLVLGLVFPTLGGWLAVLLHTADATLIKAAELLGRLPGASWDVFAPGLWLTVCYYGVLLALAWKYFSGRTIKPRFKDSRVAPKATAWAPTLVLGIALATFGVALTTYLVPRREPDRLVVTALSVGAGSATVIELPDGRCLLFDAGTLSPYDVGRATVVPFLRYRGISSIDRIYLSHPNLDHFGGVPSIVEAIPSGPVVVNRLFATESPPGSPSRRLLELLDAAGHEVQTLGPAESTWAIGGVKFELLWPGGGSLEGMSANDTSTVLRLAYKGHSILLTGDIEEAGEWGLVERGGLNADVLILPHHGSVVATTPAFIEAVGARALIRSAHERTADTASGLNELAGGAMLFNTADVGAVEVMIDGGGVQVRAVGPLASAEGRRGVLRWE